MNINETVSLIADPCHMLHRYGVNYKKLPLVCQWIKGDTHVSVSSCCHFPLQKDTLENFKCGGDFLPSPLASKPNHALKTEPVLSKLGLLTAVAVAVENDHTIAFLGNSQGQVFKVVICSISFLSF